MPSRHLSAVDRFIGAIDNAVRTVFGPPTSSRPDPGADVDRIELDSSARERAGRLMRVNHTGEVCAQALYHGQALTASRGNTREALERAALEENDHLAWCDNRLRELGGRTSYLNPLWYAGAFAIGAAVGLLGDRRSLGFLAETERQVVAHLDRHLSRLPADDHKSRAILRQMRADEAGHATVALEHGAVAPPEPAKRVMSVTSKIMTGTAYWI